MLWQILVNDMVNFCKTAQHPGSPIRMIQESFPRSTLVPCACLTSFDSGSLQNGCPCNVLHLHPNGNQAVNAIVDDQGINQLHELRYLTNTDVETLCKCCRTRAKDVINPMTTQRTQHKKQKPHWGSVSAQV